MHNLLRPAIAGILAALLAGCSGSHEVQQPTTGPQDEAALDHYIQGSILDEKEDYAKAILEYQDALRDRQDPAIYHSIAKDYSLLGKHDLAIQNGEQAVRLAPDNRTYHETLADIYLNALDLENAIKQYEDVVRVDSSYQEGWLNLARLTQLRKPEDALKVYRTMLERFGPSPDVYFQMAQIYDAANRLNDAANALRGMLDLDPGNYEIKKALGDIYLKEDSVDRALEVYQDLSEVHPENLELRAAIAHAYLVKQDYQHAADQFESVMRKDTLSIEDQIRFGQVFVTFIQKDSAVAPYALKLFEKIQQSHPSDWRPYWFLGAIDNIMRDDSSALMNFTKVKQLASWNPDGWVGVASIYYDRNEFDEAVSTLTEAKKFVPEEFRVYFLLGVSYQRLHDDVPAAQALEKALQLNDKSVEAMTALGLVYDELKRHEDSDSLYERALRLDPSNHLILNNYSYSLAERGLQLERARRMSQEAVKQQPNNQSYLDTFGWIYYQLGDYQEAERWIKRAVDIGNASAVITEHLGDVYYKLSEKDKAMEYWRKALELDSSNQSLKDKIQRGAL